jgi:hypothetical protein
LAKITLLAVVDDITGTIRIDVAVQLGFAVAERAIRFQSISRIAGTTDSIGRVSDAKLDKCSNSNAIFGI